MSSVCFHKVVPPHRGEVERFRHYLLSVFYLDDGFLVAATEKERRKNVETVRDDLRRTGVHVAEEKSLAAMADRCVILLI